MITLIGALLGFVGSIAPDIFGFFKAKQDNSQELAIMDKQIELQKAGFSQRLEEINAQADIAESAALNDRFKPIGIKWVDALGASVRPIITYLFFIAYLIVKIAQYYSLVDVPELPWLKNMAWYDMVLKLWGPEDWGLFSAVITFWFGSRSMNKIRGHGA